ncbi:hypothetical protein JCM10213v2_008648 [Rhodosporidiobolus nylandii]
MGDRRAATQAASTPDLPERRCLSPASPPAAGSHFLPGYEAVEPTVLPLAPPAYSLPPIPPIPTVYVEPIIPQLISHNALAAIRRAPDGALPPWTAALEAWHAIYHPAAWVILETDDVNDLEYLRQMERLELAVLSTVPAYPAADLHAWLDEADRRQGRVDQRRFYQHLTLLALHFVRRQYIKIRQMQERISVADVLATLPEDDEVPLPPTEQFTVWPVGSFPMPDYSVTMRVDGETLTIPPPTICIAPFEAGSNAHIPFQLPARTTPETAKAADVVTQGWLAQRQAELHEESTASRRRKFPFFPSFLKRLIRS